MYSKRNDKILLTIFTVCLVVPFSIDIFLSSLPEMKLHFQNANTSLIISVFLLGFAISQPFYGPLLERFGRRPVLLAGLLLYVCASGFLLFINSFSLLLMARFFQALGACSAVITVPAIVRDVYQKNELVKKMSFIMAMIGISPILAPLFGSFLTHFFSWRANFVFLFALGLFYILLVQFFFKETIAQKNLNALQFKNIIRTYLDLAKQSTFLGPCLAAGFSYSIMFSYLNLSSLFIIQQMHFSVISYGLFIALNGIPILAMSAATPRVAKLISLQKIMQIGFCIIFVGGISIIFFNKYFNINIYSFLIPMFIVTLGIGLIRPSASASALGAADKKVAGYASAFLNFLGFISASVVTVITSKLVTSIEEFGVFICLLSVAALVVLWWFAKLFRRF